MSWLRASSIVAGATLASRVLGFVRDVLLAQGLGADIASDAFLVALKLPNLTRRLFAEGAFASAFVPIMGQTHARDGLTEARRFAERAGTLLGLVLLAVTGLGMVLMPLVIAVIAPGFGPGDPRQGLSIELARWTFLYVVAISLTALVAGALNVLGRFAAAALAPLILNLVLIAVLLTGTADPIANAHRLAQAVPVAGVLQLAWVWLACARAGMPLLPRLDLRDPRLRRLWRLLLPGIAGAGVYQLNVVIGTIMATALSPGAVAFLYFADRLAQFPLGLVGVALSTALLPLMTRRIAEHRHAAALDARNRAMELGLILTLPATVGLLVLAEPIVVTLFARGAFDARAVAATSAALQLYALGLPAAVLVRILAAARFAHADTRTPLIGAVAALLVNLVVGLSLMGPFGHMGLALAASLGSWANLGLLAWQARRTDGSALDRQGWQRSALALLAALLAGAAARLVHHRFDHGFVGLAVALGCAVAVHLAVLLVTGALRPAELRGLLRERA